MCNVIEVTFLANGNRLQNCSEVTERDQCQGIFGIELVAEWQGGQLGAEARLGSVGFGHVEWKY
jgi:hypothetical protein